MAQIIFIKLGNGNVQILKEVNSNAQQPINEPIASLHPLQNIIRDNANPNNIIIKSAIGNNLDRGIVLDVNNINGGACVPIIENTNIDSLINSLAKDFFFDAGNEIVEVDSYFNFPAIGFSGKIYVAVDTLLMYRWNGSNYDLYARGTSVTNYENIMFSDKEFKKTFYAIFPTGVNKKVDLLFPNYLSLNIDADIEVAIQSYNLATGTLKKTFTIIKNALSDEFVRYQSNNSTVDNDYILNQFSIGEAKLVNDTQLSIPILKRVDTSSIYLKIEVKYKTATSDLTNNGTLVAKAVFDDLVLSDIYTDATFIPVNYETKKFLPTDYQNKNNFLSIDPVTKVIYEVARPTIPVNFFKKVIFNGGLQSYISNNGFGDILDSEVTGANELQREILPSNTLIQFQNSGFLKGFVGIASDNDVIIDVYKAYCSLNGDYLDLFTLIYSFPLNSNGGQSIGFPNLFISGGQVVRLGVRSSIAKTNEVNIQGTFYII